jgi:hypothetical protein
MQKFLKLKIPEKELYELIENYLTDKHDVGDISNIRFNYSQGKVYEAEVTIKTSIIPAIKVEDE